MRQLVSLLAKLKRLDAAGGHTRPLDRRLAGRSITANCLATPYSTRRNLWHAEDASDRLTATA